MNKQSDRPPEPFSIAHGGGGLVERFIMGRVDSGKLPGPNKAEQSKLHVNPLFTTVAIIALIQMFLPVGIVCIALSLEDQLQG